MASLSSVATIVAFFLRCYRDQIREYCRKSCRKRNRVIPEAEMRMDREKVNEIMQSKRSINEIMEPSRAHPPLCMCVVRCGRSHRGQLSRQRSVVPGQGWSHTRAKRFHTIVSERARVSIKCTPLIPDFPCARERDVRYSIRRWRY